MHLACLNGAPPDLIEMIYIAAGDDAEDLLTLRDACQRTSLSAATTASPCLGS